MNESPLQPVSLTPLFDTMLISVARNLSKDNQQGAFGLVNIENVVLTVVTFVFHMKTGANLATSKRHFQYKNAC